MLICPGEVEVVCHIPINTHDQAIFSQLTPREGNKRPANSSIWVQEQDDNQLNIIFRFREGEVGSLPN